ncbi:MAG: hypothetical protein A3J51_06270 [Omnitrophica WOR_2 bacterium RIFCSPHIGHO2_02_FULL_45_21]|nr:MAG: hypothetical protein A3J51_06270 [Omnitrophica WOR_2 bacterium RIFCSPHIGHO2_02_FULL_45_21]
MKIDLNQFPEAQVIELRELEQPLDLEVSGIKILSAIEIKAEALKLRDNLDVKIDLKTMALMQCSRCLTNTEVILQKDFRLDYIISKHDSFVDLSEDIRQEIILDYPLKPLCKSSCKGLCVKCGKNLNEGDCKCVSV